MVIIAMIGMIILRNIIIDDHQKKDEDEAAGKSYDPGALLAISLTTITAVTFNVMLGGLLPRQML